MIADPDVMTRKQLDAWMSDCPDYVIANAVGSIAATMVDAMAIAKDWIDTGGEQMSAAGWGILSMRGSMGLLSEADVRGQIERIEKSIHSAPNRTRYAMNLALISIGGTIPALSEKAMAAAKRIGPVEVDHGETGCKTPDAIPYILNMLKRAEAKSGRGSNITRVAGAGAAKKKKKAAKKVAKKSAKTKAARR
jgi:hypothetical protein